MFPELQTTPNMYGILGLVLAVFSVWISKAYLEEGPRRAFGLLELHGNIYSPRPAPAPDGQQLTTCDVEKEKEKPAFRRPVGGSW